MKIQILNERTGERVNMGTGKQVKGERACERSFGLFPCSHVHPFPCSLIQNLNFHYLFTAHIRMQPRPGSQKGARSAPFASCAEGTTGVGLV